MITSIENLEKIIRSLLIEQSQLEDEFVRNSLTLYGAMLDQETSSNIFETITPEQNVVLFELINRQNDSDFTETIDDIIRVCTSFTVHVIIYGDSAKTLSNILIGRLRSEKVRDDLLDQGIYLESTTFPEGIQEYKNGVMWIRNDFDINISCELEVTPVSSDYTVEKLNDIIIQTIEEAQQ